MATSDTYPNSRNADDEGPPAIAHFYQVMRSICATAIHSIQKLYLGQTSIAILVSKLRGFFSGEPLPSVIGGHLRVVRALNRSGARALIHRHPYYVNKYARDYLANSFNKAQRREALLFHHNYLTEKQITERFYEEVLENSPYLWNEIIDGNQYAIRMTIHLRHQEGDLSLIFLMNDRELYGISFSIVPGKMVDSAGNQALLIGNIQGRLGEAEAIRVGTQACHDVAPPYLLLAAVSSIADVLAIKTIAGVGNEEQIIKARKDDSGCYFDYDRFWKTLSLKKNSANFYEGSVPLREKSIKLIKSKNRGRTRLKRRFRQQVFEHVGATFAKLIAQTASRP